MKKYKLTDEIKTVNRKTLHRIQALKDFADVKIGDLGGWIEKEENLSQDGNCWVYDSALVFNNARVYGNAWVYGNAGVSGNAKVYGNVEVFGNAWVFGDAWVYGDAWVFGDAWVYGNARVYGNAEVYDNARVCEFAWVFGDAKVYGITKVYGYARVYGNAKIYNKVKVSGNRKISGNEEVYGNKKIGCSDRINENINKQISEETPISKNNNNLLKIDNIGCVQIKKIIGITKYNINETYYIHIYCKRENIIELKFNNQLQRNNAYDQAITDLNIFLSQKD